jgi:hypothetical protein
MTTWHFKSKSSGVDYAIELALRWEVSGDPITDDYSPDEIDASEIWAMWRQQYPEDSAEVHWLVVGEHIGAEFVPFVDRAFSDENFLTFYTWPVDEDGNRLRWLDLPVLDKLWREGDAEKGGFIQEFTGWKPSPFQQHMDVALIEKITTGMC